MSHSRNSRAIRDLRDSEPTQDDRDREANAIIRDLADRDDGSHVRATIDRDVTGRVRIDSMDARLAEIVAEHDAASTPLYTEFAPAPHRLAPGDIVYSLDDYRHGRAVTLVDLPSLPDREPSWGRVLRMGIVDVLAEVL
jgi:hypothetical protein